LRPPEPAADTVTAVFLVETTVTLVSDRRLSDDIKAAFQAAGVGTAGMVVPRDLRSRVLPLQAA
jgi:hypothetical protein